MTEALAANIGMFILLSFWTCVLTFNLMDREQGIFPEGRTRYMKATGHTLLFGFFCYELGAVAIVVVGDPLFSFIVAFAASAAMMDEASKSVYAFLDLIPFVVTTICVITRFVNTGFELNIFTLLPVLFVLATAFARGLADNLFMLSFALYGLAYADPLVTLVGFTAAYIAQLFIRLRYCRSKGIPVGDRTPEHSLPFMPALYIGFIASSTIFVLFR